MSAGIDRVAAALKRAEALEGKRGLARVNHSKDRTLSGKARIRARRKGRTMANDKTTDDDGTAGVREPRRPRPTPPADKRTMPKPETPEQSRADAERIETR